MSEFAPPPTFSAQPPEGETNLDLPPPPSRLKKILRLLAWTFFALFLMVFFTILKLPEDRVRNFIQGSIANSLGAQNIGFTAGEGHLSILKGGSYTMKDVVLSLPPPAEPLKLEEVSVTPMLLPILTGKLGASFRLRGGSGELSGTFSMKQNNLSFSYSAKGLDIGKMGIVAALAGIKAGAVVNGTGELSGDLNIPTSINGHLALDLSQIVIDAQSIQGFSVPRSTISEGKADIAVDKGKATIRTLRLGKPGDANEDIRATVTGDMTLSRALNQSNVNFKADFFLSQKIMKSFVLLDALLGIAKQPDGSYAFNITGPFSSPMAVPSAPGAK